MSSAVSQPSFHLSMLQTWSAFSDEFVAVWDGDGKQMVFFNDAFLQFFGYADRTEFKKEYTLFGMRKHKLEPEEEGMVMDTLHQKLQWTEEVLFQKRDGELYVGRLDIAGFDSEDQSYILQRIINIDSSRFYSEELEAKVEQRTLELKEALGKERELSDLKSRFVSMASHEFRTPLSTILSSVSLIGKYVDSTEQDKRDKHILRIRSAVNNLTDILNEFLSLGKIEEGKIQMHIAKFNLKEQVQLIVNEMRSIRRPGQVINYHHEGHEFANLDVALLRNILINLISNAIKFSPENAPIHVNTRCAEAEVKIQVSDQGMGIPEEDRKHLFERFFRGANVTNIQGTGLGLHIVSKYVELMGGDITVDSRLELGTTFTIKFHA